MKNFLKKLGRFFIVLKQRDEITARQAVLLVDGSFILPNNFALIIRGVKDRFKNAHVTVLTFEEKKEFIRENFPDIEIIIPNSRIIFNKYRMAIRLFSILRGKFRFVILSSLDISLVLVSLAFCRGKVFLHNKWMEWYRLRRRTILDILQNKRSDNRNSGKKNGLVKAFLKSLGRVFVILSDVDDKDTNYPVLVVDSGFTDINHILTVVRKIEEKLINPEISVLTFENRKDSLEKMLPGLKINIAKGTAGRYSIAREMLKLRKGRFGRVIITSLDISPVAVSLLFYNSELHLYNRWHQWWSVNFKNIFGYLKDIFSFLASIPVFIYLLLLAGLILLRMHFRLFLANLKSIAGEKEQKYGTI